MLGGDGQKNGDNRGVGGGGVDNLGTNVTGRKDNGGSMRSGNSKHKSRLNFR